MIHIKIINSDGDRLHTLQDELFKFQKKYQIRLSYGLHDDSLIIEDKNISPQEPISILYYPEIYKVLESELFLYLNKNYAIFDFIYPDIKQEFFILKDSIFYIESVGRKTLIHEVNDSKLSNFSMNHWRLIFDCDKFVECHRGVMVNIGKILTIKSDTIILINGAKIPVSRRKKQKVKEAITLLHRNK